MAARQGVAPRPPARLLLVASISIAQLIEPPARTCRETHIALGYRFDSQSIFSQVYAPWFTTRAPKHRVAMWRQQHGPCDMALSGEPRRGKHPPERHQFRLRRPRRVV